VRKTVVPVLGRHNNETEGPVLGRHSNKEDSGTGTGKAQLMRETGGQVLGMHS
jgi:hypothetical protein